MSWWEKVVDFTGLIFVMLMTVQTTQFFKF